MHNVNVEFVVVNCCQICLNTRSMAGGKPKAAKEPCGERALKQKSDLDVLPRLKAKESWEAPSQTDQNTKSSFLPQQQQVVITKCISSTSEKH